MGKNKEKDILSKRIKAVEGEKRVIIPFDEFLRNVRENPARELRGVFQLFADMIMNNVSEIPDKNMDEESINYVNWDTTKLFESSDAPYFASTVFINRLIKWIRALRESNQQNVVYCFRGKPGCGKTTMVSNLLRSMEKYTYSESGAYPETVWRINPKTLSGGSCGNGMILNVGKDNACSEDCIEITCPSHDHPILMIPKNIRQEVISDLFDGKYNEELAKITNAKEFDWVFNRRPCTICESISKAIMEKTGSIERVLESIFVRYYRLDRRRGYGITVFNPGDRTPKEFVIKNQKLQERIDAAFGDSDQVPLLFSRYARTNNGVYVLMDVKDFNKDRLLELHNIITDGVLKVEHIEERIRSLFIAVMNPGDEEIIKGKESFQSRIVYIDIPYPTEPETEIKILENIFGRQIRDRFLPQVLLNFARVIVATRMNRDLEAIKKWIKTPKKYDKYCDEDLLLLRMSIYSNELPQWLSDEDKRKLTRDIRQAIVKESEKDGQQGFDGRDSQRLFGMLLDYRKNRAFINMDTLLEFFNRQLLPEFLEKVGAEKDKKKFKEFLIAIQRQYDYLVTQELKESLFHYNDDEIRREIKNYLHALNFDLGVETKSVFTGDKFTVTEKMLEQTELKIAGQHLDKTFRDDFQKRLLGERMNGSEENKGPFNIENTEVFKELFGYFKNNAKEKVLDRFLKGGNDNNYFRQAVMAYGTPQFDKFDGVIKKDIERMIDYLVKNFGYTPETGKEMCLYVVDNQK